MEKMNDFSKIFFRLLGRSDSNFEPSKYKKQFSRLKTNLDRINFVYKDMEQHGIFPEDLIDAKNDAVAVRLRENGNKHFGRGNYVEALKSYTHSVATAQSKLVLALAYANRSACLYKLDMHEACIEDIDRAFANDYPDRLREKLISRRKHAEERRKATEAFHEETPSIPESRKNSLIQCASDCVKIEENEEFGRCVVATKDIQIGEVISVEKPYACVVFNDRWIHCHVCLELCYNLIPCKSCTLSVYCGENCKERALNTYHKYECPVLSSLAELDVDPTSLLALKVCLSAKDNFRNLNGRFDKNEYYHSDRYNEIHQFRPPTSSLDDLLRRTILGAVMFHLLQTKTDFFENEDIKDTFKDELLFLLRTMNVYSVPIFAYEKRLICYQAADYAGGCYSFFSMFNHSCCPNVSKHYHGSTIILRAVNTIKKGQQCFISYGPQYDLMPKPQRQQMLTNNLSFTCKCRACKEDWKPHLVDFKRILNFLGYQGEILALEKKLHSADVDFARELVTKSTTVLQRIEAQEPKGNALTLKIVTNHCFNTLGNKKRM